MSDEQMTQTPKCPAQLSVLDMSNSSPRPQRALWALTIVLAVLTTVLAMRWDESRWLRSALAQTAGSGALSMGGARGIYAFTGQLTAKSYGLFMMDVDSGTIWCYEIQRGANGEPQMKLVAARSWVYDRYLEEFNAADPVPSAVKTLVQQQRGAQQAEAPPAAAEPPTLPVGDQGK